MEEDVPTVIQPVFQEAYYTGFYNSSNGLLFENPITLAQGYDADIQFALEGGMYVLILVQHTPRNKCFLRVHDTSLL